MKRFKPIHAPLPNTLFKENSPFIIALVGDEQIRQKTYNDLFSPLICNKPFSIDSQDCLNEYFVYRKRRFTVVQSNEEISKLIDLSKIADLTIFLADEEIPLSSYEYLTLLTTHGLTKFCIYNLGKKNSFLKRRVYKEISIKPPIFNDSNKLFDYIRKFRSKPTFFRSNNSYLLADYFYEDCVYGYVRGASFLSDYVHVPGLGDFKVEFLERINKKEEIKYEPSNNRIISSTENNSDSNTDSSINNDSGINTDSIEEEKIIKKIGKKFDQKFQKKDIFELQEEKFKEEAEKSDINRIPGAYIKFKINVNRVKLLNLILNQKYLLIGSINSLEKTEVTGPVFSHKFSKQTIYSDKPTIISYGWYRHLVYPTLSIFNNKRRRYLKKFLDSSELTFNSAGLINTKFVLIKKTGFRILGSGTINEVGPCLIKKKCKLLGEVFKSHKNTVFIKDMFTTKEEGKKFLLGKLNSVSGLRGIIKSTFKNGIVRASFEGKLNVKDVVFLKCYFLVNRNPKIFFTAQEIDNALSTDKAEKCSKQSINTDKRESKTNRKVKDIPINLLKKLPINKRTIKEPQLPIPPEEIQTKEEMQTKEVEFIEVKSKRNDGLSLMNKENKELTLMNKKRSINLAVIKKLRMKNKVKKKHKSKKNK